MISQEYTAKELFNTLRARERRDFVLWDGEINPRKLKKEDFLEKIKEEVTEKISDKTFSFKFKDEEYYRVDHPYNSFEKLAHDMVIRKLSSIIKRLYSARQSNRNQTILYVKNYLESHLKIKVKDNPGKDYPIYMLRLDIKRFFPSIDKTRLYNHIEESFLLNDKSLFLLKSILDSTASGLPPGIGVSAPLSELVMESFDKKIKSNEGVVYYNRYVDDIIIICVNKETATDLWNRIPEMLNHIKLELNMEKSKMITFRNSSTDANDNTMSFLGYTFQSQGRTLEVTISDNKIRLLKSKIIISLKKWVADHDTDLLFDRLKFLTGNFRFKKSKDNLPAFAGLRFNYAYLTAEGEKQLSALDTFMRGLILSRNNSIGREIHSNMPPQKIQKLMKFSFLGGYKNKIMHRFNPMKIGNIKCVWR